MDTDASDFGIGAVLSQVQDGHEKVIAYASRTLNRAECNYCVTDKELLAVKNFMEYFRQYLLGRSFVVRTDHQALIWLFSLREPKGRIARWIEILSAYQFTIEYRQGKKHGNADGMSRCQDPRRCSCPRPLQVLKCGPCNTCWRKSDLMQAELIRPNIHRITSQNSQASVETPISNAERKTLNFLIYYWIFVSVPGK